MNRHVHWMTIALALVMGLAGGCRSTQTHKGTTEGNQQVKHTMETTHPTVTTQDDIPLHFGSVVTVVGRYTQLDMRKAKTGDPVYNGHAALALSDGTTVMLEQPWSDKAIRSSEEITRCDGKNVHVIGMIWPHPGPHPDGAATLRIPLVTDVQSVTLAD